MQSLQLNFVRFDLKVNILINTFETGQCPYVNTKSKELPVYLGWLVGRNNIEDGGTWVLRVAPVRWQTVVVRNSRIPLGTETDVHSMEQFGDLE